MRITEN